MRRMISIIMIFTIIGLTFWACSEDGGGTDPQDDKVHYKLYQHGGVRTTLPSYVDIMFNITDQNGEIINFLTTDNFEVLENDQPISQSESSMIIKGQGDIPYTINTVLMLDNSMSIGTENLATIKSAAIELVNQIIPNQQIAVWAFSENVVQIVDFTNNIQTLTNGINSIELGFNSTNLYGAVIEGVNQWDNIATDEQINQGTLVIMTDGQDTQSLYTIEQAIVARDNKLVFTIGLGSEVNPEILTELGNGGYLSVVEISELSTAFQEIQSQIEAYAGSFYWVNYLSPKRGDNLHSLKVLIKENDNTDSTSFILDTFSSAGFYSVGTGIYINTSADDQDGLSEIRVYDNNTMELKGESYFGDIVPIYNWSVTDNSKVELTVDQEDKSLAVIKGLIPGTTTLTLEDTANGYTRTFDLEVLENPVSCQIISPINNSTINLRDNVIIEVQANDISSTDITKVEIYLNDVLIETDNTSPYTFDWVVFTEESGNFKINAIAFSECGAQEYSEINLTLDLISLMVLVEGGTYDMGDYYEEDEPYVANTPVHSVNLDDFYIGRYEITQSEWIKFFNQAIFDYGSGGSYPAYALNWYDAIVYCNKRSLDEDITPCYSINGATNTDEWGTIPTNYLDLLANPEWDAVTCNWNADGYRLPTEAEWEYAAKGGVNWIDSLIYSGSNTIDGVAWYENNSENITHKVGTKAPNQLELYDMTGNVVEWTWDWLDNDDSWNIWSYYQYCFDLGTVSNPKGPINGEHRTCRSSGYVDGTYFSPVAFRYPLKGTVTTTSRYSNLGFRVVRKQ